MSPPNDRLRTFELRPSHNSVVIARNITPYHTTITLNDHLLHLSSHKRQPQKRDCESLVDSHVEGRSAFWAEGALSSVSSLSHSCFSLSARVSFADFSGYA
jgi:hypothetical protein